MRHFLTAIATFALAVSSVNAQQVYRWVDEDGVVHYSDQPPESPTTSTEAVELDVPPGIGNPVLAAGAPSAPDVSSASDQAAAAGLLEQQQRADQAEIVPYTGLEITAPEAGEVLWNIATQLQVAAILTPSLQGEHQIQWILDGQAVGTPTRSTSQTITPVYRGTHSIAANVLDEQGRTLYRSNAVTFYVQQTTQGR
ncbi:MAG: DUF4124 domain-containing protein [Pseudomonadota bacterium]